jgi:hypothetical protein
MMHYIQYFCFSELDTSFNIIKSKLLRFGSWLCCRLQVKMPTLLGPIKRANPNPWSREPFCWTQQNRHFHLKTEAEPAPET